MDVSVIIATLNRCEKLRGAFAGLERMVVPDGFEWEVVVVDNGSTDATEQVCRHFVSNAPTRYVYLCEPRKGKSYALNRGIREAKGDILAFTDDDCIVDERYLQALVREYESDPDLVVLGGRVELFDETDQAVTIQRASMKAIVDSARKLFPDPLIIGCNIAARKDLFRSVGCFDVLLGPGTEAVSAEDVDFIYRAYRSGYKVAYCPSVVVYHNHGRKSQEEIGSLLHKYHIGRGAFYGKHSMRDSEVRGMVCGDVRSMLKRIVRGKGRRGAVRFMQGIMKGALTRISLKGFRDESKG